nr:hypothetical protein CFP56_56567 [Quercus suber]
MVNDLKLQLDKDVDHHCEPFGSCGASGAPFKVRCVSHGYTFVGKGTTSRLWSTVSREAQFYQVLRSAQGSAIPVFLGSIDMTQTYFLHGAGEIQYMLLMVWGGQPITQSQWRENPVIMKALKISHAEIHQLGVRHGDVRPANALWTSELNRVLVIDFHKSELINKQTRVLKRKSESVRSTSARRLHLTA